MFSGVNFLGRLQEIIFCEEKNWPSLKIVRWTIKSIVAPALSILLKKTSKPIGSHLFDIIYTSKIKLLHKEADGGSDCYHSWSNTCTEVINGSAEICSNGALADWYQLRFLRLYKCIKSAFKKIQKNLGRVRWWVKSLKPSQNGGRYKLILKHRYIKKGLLLAKTNPTKQKLVCVVLIILIICILLW